MTQITFDKLKENCIREFCSKNTRNGYGYPNAGSSPVKVALVQIAEFKETGKFKNPRKLIVEIENECVNVIERTDIRNLKPLIELCPDSIPQWIKNGSYVLDLTDKGWAFFKN